MKTHLCPGCGTATRRVAATFGKNLLPLDLVPVHPIAAKRDFWTGGFPVAGAIAPEICPECDLVSWFVQREDADPAQAAGSETCADLPVVRGDKREAAPVELAEG